MLSSIPCFPTFCHSAIPTACWAVGLESAPRGNFSHPNQMCHCNHARQITPAFKARFSATPGWHFLAALVQSLLLEAIQGDMGCS